MATLLPIADRETEITAPTTLEALQHLVGGYVEFLHFADGSALALNEEGRLRGLEPNPRATALAVAKGRPAALVGDAVFFSRTEMDAMRTPLPTRANKPERMR